MFPRCIQANPRSSFPSPLPQRTLSHLLYAPITVALLPIRVTSDFLAINHLPNAFDMLPLTSLQSTASLVAYKDVSGASYVSRQ